MSIRTRLTLWYVLLLAVVLLLFSGTFYGILSVSLNAGVDQTLQDRANQVLNSFLTKNALRNIQETGQIQPPSLDVLASSSIFIQITNHEGEIRTKSRNLGGYNLPVTQEIIDLVMAGNAVRTDLYIQDVSLRIFSAPIVFDGRIIGMVQVAQPLTDVIITLRRVLFSLIGGSILALLTATLMGVMLAQMSLRSIDQITQAANKIVSAEDLGQRLPVRGANDELDRLSHTMNGMLARLDNFFQAQTRLSADISHELRTPLMIIRGNVDLLRTGDETPEERVETINAIDSALDRMSRIVSDLLLLSQADAGLSLTMRPVEVEPLALEVFQQAHALSKGVGLRIGRLEPLAVFGDEDRLKQLLINLIDNGLKHTPPGGCVTISAYRQDGWARVSVADTGSGIASDDLPHIFDRFYRGKGQNRRGSGLGLAIAKWIAQAHRGTLTAESQVGNGSTFILKLPLITEDDDKEDERLAGEALVLPTISKS